ncbi:hypothetical protein [Lederbergia citri]|uniref:Uncharacterized protein n=1 Tax=Lederbergia citri TaxID=2833580 RepID=A0A942TGA3_9BACI|nr:hypothetical protein [Lederbergia citri]MBS4197108.1 hypothetical protein [Lederbergia citri]
MIDLYTVEKKMELEEKERQRNADIAWMLPERKPKRHVKNTLVSAKKLLDIRIRISIEIQR